MANQSDKAAKAPVHRGEVASVLVTDLLECFRELEQRRVLGDDLAEWFDANPKASESFRRHQDRSAKRRAKLAPR